MCISSRSVCNAHEPARNVVRNRGDKGGSIRLMRALLLLSAALLMAPSVAAQSADAKQECVRASDEGQALRREGKLKRARERFLACSAETCPSIVSKACTEWVRTVTDSMPTLVVGAEVSGRDIVDADWSIDGERVGSRLDGRPIALDPGEHVVRVEAPELPPSSERIVLRMGEKNRVHVAHLKSREAKAPLQPPPASSPWRWVTAGSLVGVGVLAAGAGAVFGLQADNAATKASDRRASMPSDACGQASSPMCEDLARAVDDQRDHALWSRALFVGAGVFVVAGVVTWLLWPKPREGKPSAGLLPNGDLRIQF